ncbi:MAG: hypothetical protein VKL39_02605 [Leptolyngbyaceae bacterium]|nr:hypothetical protein [Leptolyngbyaceae bacterium]
MENPLTGLLLWIDLVNIWSGKSDNIHGEKTVSDEYLKFLDSKTQYSGDHGFDPIWVPDKLFPFQKYLLEYSLRKGRSAIFADCGLGKTGIQLAWAENVAQKTGKPVLVLTPIAVGHQTVKEGEKFGVECKRSLDGKVHRITIANYERLHYFSPNDFGGVVCDESSILKNFRGKTSNQIVDFMRHTPYRLLCTATASPNDYMELGTSSEALGELGYQDMVSTFFRQVKNTDGTAWGRQKYTFRAHAINDFWRWVCSWSRAVRKPSDIGFDDSGFILPDLETFEHVAKSSVLRPGQLFEMPAQNIQEQSEERRRTLKDRCHMVADLVDHDDPVVIWCHLNPEGDYLQKIIPGSVQVSGSDSEEKKEKAFMAFCDGSIKRLITKPSIAGFGQNWQHCGHQTFFPSHSFEEYYQAVRRCLRFGRKGKVRVDIISSEGEYGVLENLNRKAKNASAMFDSLIENMNNAMRIDRAHEYTKKEVLPSWLLSTK